MSVLNPPDIEIPSELVGRGYMRNTRALFTTWQQLQNEIPANLLPELQDSCFVLIKPDMLASKKEHALWSKLIKDGIQPLVSWVCLQSGIREFEELYKFNLTINNEQCMLSSWWLHNLPYQMGPVICLLVRVPKQARQGLTACDYIAQLKGPSNPFMAKDGQWRYDMVSTNMALNLIHSSDDPISSVREFRIFGCPELLLRALERSKILATDAESEEVVIKAVHSEFTTAIEFAGYPHYDLDLVSNLVRHKLRLAHSIGAGDWIPGHLREKFQILLCPGGTATERWQHYKYLCVLEMQEYATRSSPEILRELATPAQYCAEFANLLAAELHKYRLPYSDWEKIVIDTTLFFHRHLP